MKRFLLITIIALAASQIHAATVTGFICNLLGQQLSTQNFEVNGNNVTMPLSLKGMAGGMYFVSIEMNGKILVAPLVVKN